MKKLGNILHLSNRGRIILRSHQTPALGLTVFNSRKTKIGFIHDVFGPTKDPYISVKTDAKNSKNFENRVGDSIYVPKQAKKKWGRRKRKKN
ncbi:MAG: Gar1/Naf1 family protein [Methanobacterium sp.]|jgi:RNA-binding protein|nr:Gar1/Naf1 family protein [Methanobacterium sp.]